MCEIGCLKVRMCVREKVCVDGELKHVVKPADILYIHQQCSLFMGVHKMSLFAKGSSVLFAPVSCFAQSSLHVCRRPISLC